MLGPIILTRVEYWSFRASLWIDSSHARGFSQRTGHASQSQVPGNGAAATRERFDVINMKRSLLSYLRKMTVLHNGCCSARRQAAAISPEHFSLPRMSFTRLLFAREDSTSKASPQGPQDLLPLCAHWQSESHLDPGGREAPADVRQPPRAI